MTQEQDVQAWIGHDAVDESGDKVGTIDEIYVDDATGQPEWLAVKTGMFGSKLSFVPLQGATRKDDALCVPFSKDLVKDAPKVDPDGHLEPEEEDRLYRHYGREDPSQGQQQAQAEAKGGEGNAGGDDSETMTRSEEELAVGTRSRETGKVRLRKYIVTENVTTTVPVQREEVRVEREPIADGEGGGGELGEDEQEMVLHEEEVVAEKKVVGKEKVRLDKDTVSEEQQVSEEVRKEQIEVDEGDKDQKRR